MWLQEFGRVGGFFLLLFPPRRCWGTTPPVHDQSYTTNPNLSIQCRAETVVGRVGAENRDEVLATTILAYALSTIMTGAVFMALGYFKVNPFLDCVYP